VEKLLDRQPKSTELHYFQGVIAANQSEYQKAETELQTATELDPEFIEKTDLFRTQMADRYLSFAVFFRNLSRATSRRMLFKGVRFCRGHEGIKKMLLEIFNKDTEAVQQALDAGDINAAELIENWSAKLRELPYLKDYLNREEESQILSLNGRLFATKGEPRQSLACYEQAVNLTPDDPDLHIQITHIQFSLGNFQQGIEHLRKAVELDREYAIHWENLGDSLQNAGQHQEAIYAYEQCFTARPESIETLKKMGDCYIALNQLEAAREAYLQYKSRLSN